MTTKSKIIILYALIGVMFTLTYAGVLTAAL